MIGLRSAARDQRVAVTRQSVGNQKLQLARFVAAGRQAKLVVALDPDLWAIERLGEVRREVDWRRAVGVAAARKTG